MFLCHLEICSYWLLKYTYNSIRDNFNTFFYSNNRLYLKKKSMYYGNKIRFLRKKRGLTQQEIARKLSMSQKSYSNIENNKCDVRLTKFLKLSLILGFRPADFFKDTAIFLNQPLNTMESVYVENLYLKKEINHYKALVQDKKNIITLLKKQITRNKTVRS